MIIPMTVIRIDSMNNSDDYAPQRAPTVKRKQNPSIVPVVILALSLFTPGNPADMDSVALDRNSHNSLRTGDKVIIGTASHNWVRDGL